MRGVGKQLLGGTDLAQPAEIHHRDPVADCFYHSQIVGDEEQRQPKTRLHILEQIEDLCANRDVERRYRLVADDELGIEDQRAGNADALALSAGKLVRQASDHQTGIEADGGEHFGDELLAFFRILDACDHQRLGDDIADPPPWVQGGNRILKDQLHAPAHPPQGIALHRREVLAVEHDSPRDGPAQLKHRAAQRGLAAAGLADQAERLAARDLQADVGHRMDRLAADGILDDEVFHREQRIAQSGLPGVVHHALTPAAAFIGWKQAY